MARSAKKLIIRHLKSADAETRLVSAADKLNNVRSILSDYREVGESIWARFNGGREGTLWYYRALLEEFLAEQAEPVDSGIGTGGAGTRSMRRESVLELLAVECQEVN